MFRKPEVKFNPEDYEVRQVFYESKDKTRVPMFIVHKKGIALNGKNPCFLTAYGGFNISLQPGFSPSTIVLLENGCVFAQPNLRGGGEYGETWHKAGMFEKKQNVFDDFIAAAEYLIKEKYTSSDKLAIEGGSNGGLLVGAVMTQRPELYKVALPAVGVMDMLRYHKFTVGWGWAVEYGSSDKEKDFKYLYAYSPLHNLKPGVAYPATMVTTADHDDRVVPAHSFKFIATLQADQAGPEPGAHPDPDAVGARLGQRDQGDRGDGRRLLVLLLTTWGRRSAIEIGGPASGAASAARGARSSICRRKIHEARGGRRRSPRAIPSDIIFVPDERSGGSRASIYRKNNEPINSKLGWEMD